MGARNPLGRRVARELHQLTDGIEASIRGTTPSCEVVRGLALLRAASEEFDVEWLRSYDTDEEAATD